MSCCQCLHEMRLNAIGHWMLESFELSAAMEEIDPPMTKTEQLEQHNELLKRLDIWFERLEVSIRQVQAQPFFGAHFHSQRPSKSSKQSGNEKDSKESRIELARNSLATEQAVHNSRSTKRQDSYSMAVIKSTHMTESVKRLWSEAGSGGSLQTHRQVPSTCAKIWMECQQYSAAIVHSHAAGIFFGIAILSNSVFLGIQLEWRAQHRYGDGDSSWIFPILHTIYATLFTVEVLLRFIADGIWSYLLSREWMWNWLDVFVVVSSWTELILEFVNPTGSTSNLSGIERRVATPRSLLHEALKAVKTSAPVSHTLRHLQQQPSVGESAESGPAPACLEGDSRCSRLQGPSGSILGDQLPSSSVSAPLWLHTSLSLSFSFSFFLFLVRNFFPPSFPLLLTQSVSLSLSLSRSLCVSASSSLLSVTL